MTTLPEGKLDTLLTRHSVVEAELSRQLPPEQFVKLSREFAEIDPVVAKIKAYREVAGELADLEALIADPKTEAAMREMADDERRVLMDKRERIVEELRLALLPKDAMDERNVIVEIRAGTGGDEAALFAGDLFRMYERFAARQGWTIEILSLTEGTKGGFKEIVAEIKGRGPFARLKFESGGHRVQRVPETETQGRVHTSAATVAVLPEAEDVDIEIKPDDSARSTPCGASGAGGQHVNKTESAIRITHLPSRHRRLVPGRNAPAQEPRQGHARAARPGSMTPRTREHRQALVRPTAKIRSARATAPSASAPTTSRRTASPTTASISRSTICPR